VTMVRDDRSDWREEESFVDVFYRGTGLEKALARQVEEILQRDREAKENNG